MPPEPTVDCIKKPPAGTEIDTQCVTPIFRDALPRFKISADVSAAETVDRLPGISDQKQCAGRKNTLADLPLYRIGILKII